MLYFVCYIQHIHYIQYHDYFYDIIQNLGVYSMLISPQQVLLLPPLVSTSPTLPVIININNNNKQTDRKRDRQKDKHTERHKYK